MFRWRLILQFLHALSIAVLTGVALAQPSPTLPPTDPVPIDRFFKRPAVSDSRLSPSGTKVAITTSRGGSRIGLAVIDFSAATPKTSWAVSFSDADVAQFNWVGDNRLVFGLVDLETGSGEDTRYAPGLYAVDPDGKNLRNLVKRQGKPILTSGNATDRSLEWNHRLLAVPLPQEGVDPEDVVIGNLNYGENEIKDLMIKVHAIAPGSVIGR